MLENLLEGCAEYYFNELSEKIIRGMTENALSTNETLEIINMHDLIVNIHTIIYYHCIKKVLPKI